MRTTLLAALSSVALAQAPQTHQIVMTRVFPQPGQIGLFIAAADGSDERPLVTPAEHRLRPGVGAGRLGHRLHVRAQRLRRSVSRQARRHRPRASHRQPGVRRSGGVLARRQAAGLRQHARRRHGGPVDDGSADARAKALTSGAGGDFRPSWSPDGQWIAFSSDRTSNLPFAHGRWEHLQLVDLYIVHPDGTGLKRLTPHGDFCGSPKWTADSRRVVAVLHDGRADARQSARRARAP